MNMSNLLELAIIAFIVIGIGAAIWRGGARNPVGTGGLDRKLTTMGSEVHAMRTKVGDIERRVENMESSAANATDIARIESTLKEHADEVAALARTLAATSQSIRGMADTLPDINSRLRATSQQIGELRELSAARGEAAEHTRKQVDRLYDVLVTRGMER